MLDNQTRRELLSKARQSGFPGSILDVFTAYEQGKDIIGEFQQQQQQQQGQQMSDMAAQQAGMMAPGQQPLPQEMPQAPAGPPPGLQGQSLPSPEPPANPNLVDSTQQQPVGMATNAKGSSGGQILMANGGFVEKFTDDQYNKFSSHFPFSKEQRGSIAHNATVEHPDLTMVQGKKYVFGGLKYKTGGMKTDPPSYTLPTGGLEGDPLKKGNIATAADSSYVAEGADAAHNFYKKAGYMTIPAEKSAGFSVIRPSEIFTALADEREIMYNYQNYRGRSANYSDYTNYEPGQHRFEQRELTTGQLNLEAPRSKYDNRILPQGMVTYQKESANASDIAEVPKYDKLAVTPWKELSDKQKIQRLQQYGGSGTPYKDKASVKQGIQDLKNPVPQPKMIEAKPLPLPTVDIKPQLQNIPSISNPYPAKPETEYFIMPSGNPGVGVIHGREYNDDGTYTQKVVGPSLAKDWFNDADQKRFDNDDMSGRIDYDPRDKDPDHKIYYNMYDATQEVEKLRKGEKQSNIQNLRLKKRVENESKQSYKFATGGKKLLKKRR